LPHLIETVGTLDWRGIGFRSLTENIDTTMAGGRLVFHLFGALAQFERDILRERTLAGLQAAARRGRKGGRPKAMDDAKIEAARRLLDSGMPVKDVAATLESASARSIATLASDGMGCRVRDTGRAARDVSARVSWRKSCLSSLP
jgi:DNA invertase Pin-like site-specific DNA recombinase